MNTVEIDWPEVKLWHNVSWFTLRMFLPLKTTDDDSAREYVRWVLWKKSLNAFESFCRCSDAYCTALSVMYGWTANMYDRVLFFNGIERAVLYLLHSSFHVTSLNQQIWANYCIATPWDMTTNDRSGNYITFMCITDIISCIVGIQM